MTNCCSLASKLFGIDKIYNVSGNVEGYTDIFYTLYGRRRRFKLFGSQVYLFIYFKHFENDIEQSTDDDDDIVIEIRI